ncbi:MAG: aldehyde dehydrogenase [Sporomusaceae bacterium]|nr:aldehyde dehydrogenase [Sporomusaceae bacterium]
MFETTQAEDFFWQLTMQLLGYDPAAFNDPDNPPACMPVRVSWPTTGAPAWKITENVVFIRLILHEDDDYARQIDSIYKPEPGTVIKQSARTRVWDVQFVAYGPDAQTAVTQIKDGVFRQDIKRLLSANSVFLIPNLPPCRRVPELFAGQWWNRWDGRLYFNELHRLPDEDVGRIESVSIKTHTDRR